MPETQTMPNLYVPRLQQPCVWVRRQLAHRRPPVAASMQRSERHGGTQQGFCGRPALPAAEGGAQAPYTIPWPSCRTAEGCRSAAAVGGLVLSNQARWCAAGQPAPPAAPAAAAIGNLVSLL